MSIMLQQPCGIAKLLSAVLNLPLEDMWLAVGLELCPRCDKPASTNTKYYPYCGKHRGPLGGEVLPLICDGCGILFFRLYSAVNQASKRGAERVFCSNKCNGSYNGKVYGFPAHKKNTQLRTHCKFGHEFIEENIILIGSKKFRRCLICHRNYRQSDSMREYKRLYMRRRRIQDKK